MIEKSVTAYSCLIGYLTHLADAGAILKLKFHDVPDSYDCVITALSAKHSVILVDHLRPALPADALIRGKAMTIEATSEGRRITLESQYLQPLTDHRKLGYLLKIY